MKSILEKHSNAYKITYMGDMDILVLGKTIEPGAQFILADNLFATFINNITEIERYNFIYEAVLISNSIKDIIL